MKPHLIDKDTEVKSLAQITQNKQVAEPRLESRGSSLQCDEGEVQCVRVRKKKQGVAFAWYGSFSLRLHNRITWGTKPSPRPRRSQTSSGQDQGQGEVLWVE